MNILLATGIYPPAIGGPATYVRFLAEELVKMGHEVRVVTYGKSGNQEIGKSDWRVEYVSDALPILRWFLYAKRLREVAHDADVIYAFSSVSCGIPIILSGLKKPKRVLRLGGDFFWERYTDFGGRKSLREWYVMRSWRLAVVGCWIMSGLLHSFDHIVCSTEFQKGIYEKAFKKLPPHSVIENALQTDNRQPTTRRSSPHAPFRLLFLGRFVKFKNLFSLIDAVAHIPDCVLTIVGEGPLGAKIKTHVEHRGIEARVRFVAPVSGKDKQDIFAAHDLLVLPSLTEVSPNTALEARAAGLPVLLTKEHGLRAEFLCGIVPADLSTPEMIVASILRVQQGYSFVAEAVEKVIPERTWNAVATEHVRLFATLSAK